MAVGLDGQGRKFIAVFDLPEMGAGLHSVWFSKTILRWRPVF